MYAPHLGQDRDRGRVRRRQDDVRRGGVRDHPLTTEAPMTAPVGGDRRPDGHRGQDHHHGGHGLRPPHHRRRADPLPVRHPGPGPVLVHVGRPRAGAVGAVVLIDTRRLADAFAAIDFFEDRGIPFVVASTCSTAPRPPRRVGAARGAGAGARRPAGHVRRPRGRHRDPVLVTLVEHARTRAQGKYRRPACSTPGRSAPVGADG